MWCCSQGDASFVQGFVMQAKGWHVLQQESGGSSFWWGVSLGWLSVTMQQPSQVGRTKYESGRKTFRSALASTCQNARGRLSLGNMYLL